MTFDPARLVGAFVREVTTRDVDGKTAQVVIATRTYPTDIQDLWDALTQPERVSRWMGPTTGDFRPGGRFSVKDNASGLITTCDPPHHLSVTWEFEGTSWVDVRLRECSEDETELRLEHTAHTPDDFWDEYGPGATGVGWELALAALEALVARSGKSVPLDNDGAWIGSPAGKRFLQGSSAAWAEASIAAGTEADQAREAAQRTTTFYGG